MSTGVCLRAWILCIVLSAVLVTPKPRSKLHHVIHRLRKGICQPPKPKDPVPSCFKTRLAHDNETFDWHNVYLDLLNHTHYRHRVRRLRHEARVAKRLALSHMDHKHHDGQEAKSNSTVTLLETCPMHEKYLQFSEMVLHKGEWCWLLEPWRGYFTKYANCVHKSCKGVNSGFGSLYFCQPAMYKFTYFVLYCKNGHPKKTIIKRVKLPRRCSCFKWTCPFFSKRLTYHQIG